ncbi:MULTISPECIES: xanthine dehydrogenase family Fe-S subunit [unclassified Mesorhizobium]|uniref:xanthine dehydrogenase family Fe-S subunit n=1 Tax=unclassified Mesorhizobium TaxID=325217 RepID=UPI001126A20B|nr:MULTISPECIES: 2Fe-2S iron-sulfur cluster-binding protein [unclassified Mesorhizobium]MBZ9811010.1 carbon monoxide dehydrogenase [Mesorhizobium sp. ESP-6-2]TPM27786.1 carbon monoxide dehydrogenase [Mesorhizobium sp. B2-2-2]
MTRVELKLNGRQVSAEVEARTHLGDFVHDDQRLTATHLRCEQGVCGACTILVDGMPVRSCITYAAQCAGAEVTTLEGLERDPIMVALRAAFMAEHGLQCGFCTPGMLVTARDIVSRLPDADEERIRRELSGNLCRCTGYAGIVRAVKRVQDERRRGLAAAAAISRLGPAGAHHQTESVSITAVQKPAPAPQLPDADEGQLEGEVGLGARKANLETKLAFKVARPVEEVWATMEDIERVARCMPGASLAGPPVDGHIKGSVSVKIGPIATNFSGAGVVVRDEAERQGMLYGSARDRLSGSSARAEVAYAVHRDGEASTRVDLTVRALLAGPLAQFGRSGIVQDLIARIAGEFAKRLEHNLATGEHAPDSDTSFNPVSLFFSVVQARIANFFGRFFSGGKKS